MKMLRNGEHEPWAISHKRIIVNEIVFYLIYQVAEDEYKAEYWINEQIWKEIFTPFVLENDFREMKNEKLFHLFKKHLI